eukprot:TRINITY_DN1271_c0_g1_i3.p1 TRINITY_DN1271_c0_g1~~TRINITY_DN1271_c0_g1_i3.p1  ORF type:complete len:533 (-),score=93.32 TRINITY_DN1271_c0_g1_i3:750-2135(-)
MASTAAFDKSPQSQQRGITLDLGFSSFTMPSPLKEYNAVQFTLVDCPGHASLIRTIIGGAQIMDMMMLVIDIQKGIQTQTAEGIVIGSITTNKLVIALNKIDMIPEAARASAIEKMKARLGRTFASTPFAGCPIIPVCATRPEGNAEAAAGAEGLTEIKRCLLKYVDEQLVSQRKQAVASPFLMAVDHCFPIKGQGTVMTGTILRGTLQVNQTVDIPDLKLQRKVKSIQVFHRPVTSASLGDRVGVCLAQFESKTFERGLVADPGTVCEIRAAVATLQRVPYYKAELLAKSKFHVTVAHTTVMASVFFFKGCSDKFGFDQQFEYVREIPASAPAAAITADSPTESHVWVLLEFEQPILAPLGSVYIASRMDADINKNMCRLAFHGRLVSQVDNAIPAQAKTNLKIFRRKSREGAVDRARTYVFVVRADSTRYRLPTAGTSSGRTYLRRRQTLSCLLGSVLR